jgi:hypothetical protein
MRVFSVFFLTALLFLGLIPLAGRRDLRSSAHAAAQQELLQFGGVISTCSVLVFFVPIFMPGVSCAWQKLSSEG